MKKLVAILLAFVCIFSLAACGTPGNGDDPSMAPSSNEEAEQIFYAMAYELTEEISTQYQAAYLYREDAGLAFE